MAVQTFNPSAYIQQKQKSSVHYRLTQQNKQSGGPTVQWNICNQDPTALSTPWMQRTKAHIPCQSTTEWQDVIQSFLLRDATNIDRPCQPPTETSVV